MDLIKNLEITFADVFCFVKSWYSQKVMHKSVSLIPYIYTVSYGLQQTLHRLVDFFPDNAKWQEGHYPHSCRRTEKSAAQSGS